MPTEYLNPPTITETDHLISDFIYRLNEERLTNTHCMVCSRLVSSDDTEYLLVKDIPNSHLLYPAVPYEGHSLHLNMLLQQTTLHDTEQGKAGLVCYVCLSALQDNRVPYPSLANGMWIGDMPIEFRGLSLAEETMLCRWMDSVYEVYVWPEYGEDGVGGRVWNTRYVVDIVDKPADRVDSGGRISDQCVPCSLDILASRIQIIWAGEDTYAPQHLPDLLNIRQTVVASAAEWSDGHSLTLNNSGLMKIRLETLPSNGIPKEMLRSIKFLKVGENESAAEAVIGTHCRCLTDF